MPLQDVTEAVTEMRRVVKDLGFKAVFIRPNPFNGRRLNDPAYDPFWREAQELGIAVAIHSSFGTRMPTLGEERYRHDPFLFHMVCHPFEQQAACMDLICGRGVGEVSQVAGGLSGIGGRMAGLLARPHGRPLREDGHLRALAQEETQRILL